MLRSLIILFVSLLFVSEIGLSQVFFANTRVGKMDYAHSTVGTTAQEAIAAASVGGNLLTWAICHDAESSSTYLAISDGADPATDGVRVAPGECHMCPNCNPQTLKDINVKGQAAGTGYSVTQWRQ